MKRCAHCGQLIVSDVRLSPLKAFRKGHQPPLSQRGLAELVGVDRVTVARWEIGTRDIGADSLMAVAEVTGLSPATLRPDLAALFRVNGNKRRNEAAE